MSLTEYRYDPDQIATLAQEKAANLRSNRGLSDLLGFGLGVVKNRLLNDPRRYRDYGPFWWALKSLLRDKGTDYGQQSEPMVEEVYRGRTPVETLVMAEEFRDAYLQEYALYTNQFMLDGDTGEYWTLFDQDMERGYPR
ncbi:conserved hypothetical protein [Gammaproteobacteria bacterium]